MSFVKIDSADDLPRWYTIFELLGLEKASTFASEMGLRISDIEALQSAARFFVIRYADTPGSEAERIELLQQTFDRIAAATDGEAAQRLYEWGKRLFSPAGSTDGSGFLWSVLLRHLAGLDASQSGVVPLVLPEQKATRVVQIIREYLGDYAVLEEQIQDLEEQPRGDFEEYVYSRYEPGCSPLDSVIDAVESHRFRQAWEHLESLLDSDDVDALLRWGKARAREMGIPADLVVLPFQSTQTTANN